MFLYRGGWSWMSKGVDRCQWKSRNSGGRLCSSVDNVLLKMPLHSGGWSWMDVSESNLRTLVVGCAGLWVVAGWLWIYKDVSISWWMVLDVNGNLKTVVAGCARLWVMYY